MFLCHQSRCRMSVPPNTPSCPKASCHPHLQGVYLSTNHPPGSMGYPWWTPCIHLERESSFFFLHVEQHYFSFINAVIYKIGSLRFLSTSTYSEVWPRLGVREWGSWQLYTRDYCERPTEELGMSRLGITFCFGSVRKCSWFCLTVMVLEVSWAELFTRMCLTYWAVSAGHLSRGSIVFEPWSHVGCSSRLSLSGLLPVRKWKVLSAGNAHSFERFPLLSLE